MKQRLSALLLALTLLFALTACGGRGSGGDPSPELTGSPAPESSQPAETEPAGTDDPGSTETPGEEEVPEETPAPSPAPSESVKPSPSPSPSPAPSPSESVKPSPSPSPAPPVTPEPSPAPSESPDSVDLAGFYADTLTKYSLSANLAEFTGDLLEGYYPGLSAVAASQCLVYGSMMTMSMAEFALVEVADSADVDTVKSILQGRIDAQAEGGAWYPEATRVWSECSTVVTNGNYILMVVCDEYYADIAADFDALFA